MATWVGKVWVNGNDECLEQIKAGLAWHYKEYEKEQPPSDRQLYASAEQEARVEKRGLWQDLNPIPPWDSRHHTTGVPAETNSQDEPTSADRDFKNVTPLADRTSTNAPNPLASPTTNANAESPIRGNKRTMIYHWKGCPYYDQISPKNRLTFNNRDEAERAGYGPARNCL